eukprot:CAMPEP_0202353464 /NCGR_PEP_ID=MMETSP1126-20121109/9212_1 /ASSEMBLY_ACC=CAM_ASM_000457 /TAXON_ID=3047 /ORGANISM="Dunaliella tertiolecta, Strain CCMP1320" /LENGTH=86 /DNA_ID=CAMNT_0048945813 /DNA_START=516 /DNA_END=777 /DNA_ORIENTATION=-
MSSQLGGSRFCETGHAGPSAPPCAPSSVALGPGPNVPCAALPHPARPAPATSRSGTAAEQYRAAQTVGAIVASVVVAAAAAGSQKG